MEMGKYCKLLLQRQSWHFMFKSNVDLRTSWVITVRICFKSVYKISFKLSHKIVINTMNLDPKDESDFMMVAPYAIWK